MKVTITKDNINQYTEYISDDITIIYWEAGNLNAKIFENIPNLEIFCCNERNIDSIESLSHCINIKELYCCGNNLKNFKRLNNCVNIRILNCWNNQLKSLDTLPVCINLQKINLGCNRITSLEPLKNCVNLQELHCNFNNITSLEPLSNCVNLKQLHCNNNEVTSLEPLSNCVNLQYLCCSHNKISSLASLSNCVNLRDIDCSYNQITTLELYDHTNIKSLRCGNNKITSLDAIFNFTNLRFLCCNDNQITSLEPLSNCVNLRNLYCHANQITSLEPLFNCTNIQKLSCVGNQIISLKPLSNCTNIQELYCFDNQIISLEPLIYLRRLNYICYRGNPIEFVTVQIQRMLNRIQSNINSSIYNDNQNVHDTEIQRTVCDSVQNLIRDPKIHFSIDDIIKSDLSKSTIESLIEYCQDQTIHSIHLITYQELLSYVWNRITNSDHKSELIKIMNEQIADSECKCFTGRFNRTLSVLVGFFDDIQINISDKSRISAIVLNSRHKIVPYDPTKHIDLAIKELIDAGYQEAEFKDWIDAIDD